MYKKINVLEFIFIVCLAAITRSRRYKDNIYTRSP